MRPFTLLLVIALLLPAGASAATAGLRTDMHLHPPRTHTGDSNDETVRRVARIQQRLSRFRAKSTSGFGQRAFRKRRMERLVLPD